MAKKYDTNPLDPDFPKKVAQKTAEAQETETLYNLGAETKQFNGVRPTEEPTRRYDNAGFGQYSSIYSESPPPAAYQTTRLGEPEPEKPSNRKVAGVPENVLMVLPYTPFFIGLVASILELLYVPQSETKIRFHAAQGLAAHIAILLISAVLKGIGKVSDWADVGNGLFILVTTIVLIMSMVKLWRGKAVHFESLDPVANWLNEKIKMQPKNN